MSMVIVAELTEATEDILESEVIVECEDVTIQEVRTMLKFAMAIESVTIDLFSGCANEHQVHCPVTSFENSHICLETNAVSTDCPRGPI